MLIDKKKYLIGILWFILSLIISINNDAAGKFLSNNLPSIQISFLRFLFGLLSLFPFMIYYGKNAFTTNRVYMHIARGIILFLGIGTWIYGLSTVPIVICTLVTFTIPLFILMLAPIFLKEKISLHLITATIIGFIGVLIILEPVSSDFNPYSLIMLISAFLFATLDIINKKYVAKESMLSMLFYSALITTIIAFFPAFYYWQTISLNELLICGCLGAGSNLILFCLLKSFNLVAASAVAPFRYLELIFSVILGFAFFHEIPTIYTVIGALIIIPSTLYIAYRNN